MEAHSRWDFSRVKKVPDPFLYELLSGKPRPKVSLFSFGHHILLYSINT